MVQLATKFTANLVPSYDSHKFTKVEGKRAEAAIQKMFEAFIDEIFGEESALDQKKFVDLMSTTGYWIFQPTQLRERFLKNLPKEDDSKVQKTGKKIESTIVEKKADTVAETD